MEKGQAYKLVLEALHKCTTENSACMAVVILVDHEKESVKVYGLNIEEEAVPILLLETAADVGEKFISYRDRTIQ